MTQKLAQEKIIQACQDAIAEARLKRWSSVRQLLASASAVTNGMNGNVPRVAQGPRRNIKHDPRYSHSLEYGIAILSLFSDENPIWGNKEVAEALNGPRGTSHRYLSTLVAMGFLEQTANRKYRRVSLDD
jgi:hypothetical protein